MGDVLRAVNIYASTPPQVSKASFGKTARTDLETTDCWCGFTDWQRRDVVAQAQRPAQVFGVPHAGRDTSISLNIRLLPNHLESVRGMVVLSGCKSAAYKPLERSGWKRVDFDVRGNGSDKQTRRVECLWLSPSVVNHAENQKLFLSPAERKREGAYQSHKVQVATSTKRVLRAIEKLRAGGKRVTKASVARATKMSREHLSRRYGNLF